LGNWDEIETDSTAQDRDHNAQNEITSVSGSGVVQPTYDHNGNTTTFPAAIKDDFGVEVHAVYDAWNRLVRLVDDNENTLAEYQYDALHRRIVRHLPDPLLGGVPEGRGGLDSPRGLGSVLKSKCRSRT